MGGPTAGRVRSLPGRRSRPHRSRSLSTRDVPFAGQPGADAGKEELASQKPIVVALDPEIPVTGTSLAQVLRNDSAMSDDDFEDVLSINLDDDDERARKDVVNENIASLYRSFHCLSLDAPLLPHNSNGEQGGMGESHRQLAAEQR